MTVTKLRSESGFGAHMMVSVLLLLKLFIARPTTKGSSHALQNQQKMELENLIRIKMNIKIISIETTFKTVFVGGRMDTFGERVQDEGPATENALLPKLVLVFGMM